MIIYREFLYLSLLLLRNIVFVVSKHKTKINHLPTTVCTSYKLQRKKIRHKERKKGSKKKKKRQAEMEADTLKMKKAIKVRDIPIPAVAAGERSKSGIDTATV